MIDVKSNIQALDAMQKLNSTQMAVNKSFQKLSSGYRINSAADDAAGLAISESMKSQIRSYTVAERNANDAISMTQTAEASLGDMHDILGRMREIAMQASNGDMSQVDRGYIDTEFSSLKAEMSRIEGSARFNGQPLVSATAANITFQIGLNNTASDQITLTFGGLNLTTILSAGTSLAGATAGNALASLQVIDDAIQTISTNRARYGATLNRLDVTVSSIQTMRLNITSANSRIRDVDVAEETANLSKNQVLSQAGVSVLAQANQLPQLALKLLQG
ncbi:MAG TPA: flagellin [Polyangiaceae bacterium]|jgi:flagellin